VAVGALGEALKIYIENYKSRGVGQVPTQPPNYPTTHPPVWTIIFEKLGEIVK
jgi:hypothetical protein